ncbi:MAG: topoisomerase IV [Oscillospiraceae bacterium]|nr:topoisomerase IV [Oscillospiraceae bacterium]
MARQKKQDDQTEIFGLHADVIEQQITETLETNYMPYAMSVIVSRAIPEIDGFKPSQRKLLYTMYTMGLLNGGRTKSANIVGQTMKLNPHGDAAIYETMVRLAKGHQALLHPFVDSKGNFGKTYSRDMAYAASRYTEAKLAPICQELFRDINDMVEFIPNYDNTMQEPTLLPTGFPNLLVAANTGIAVGMASSICGFNLAEVCETTIEYLKNPEHDLLSTLKAPDFPTGAELLYNRQELEEIYNTGRGSFKLRAKWRFDKKNHLIEIFEIPYTTTIEAIIDKVSELVKAGKLREISDMRDESDLKGLKLTIDLKRGTDPEKLMQKLFRMTPLQDSFSCNFNILIAGYPRVMGVREILEEWSAWRIECVRRQVFAEVERKKDKLHKLKGLKKILLDIDRAIEIIRNTEEEAEVVPNLMIGFGIDEIQAEYVAEIKLRNINKEYILRRVAETADLEAEIEDLEDLLGSKARIRRRIIKTLEEISKKHGIPRQTEIVYDFTTETEEEEDDTPDYPVKIFFTRESYFKKITPQSLRMSSDQKCKEGDEVVQEFETTNKAELLVFTNRQQVYKTRLSEFGDTKASALGDYLPAKLGMDEGEVAVYVCLPGDYSGNLLFVFENGKVAKVAASGYQTKANRKRLTGAYSEKSPLIAMFHVTEEEPFVIYSTENRALVFHSSTLAPKTSRSTQGVAVMTLKPKYKVRHACRLEGSSIQQVARYQTRSLPAAGAKLHDCDALEQQITLG